MHRRHFWHARRHGGCGNFEPAFAWAGTGRHDEGPRGAELHFSFGGGDEEGAGLGVRRPLRFLAWKLDLTAEQLESAARILERLKIERAQAAVDQRRSAADLADADRARGLRQRSGRFRDREARDRRARRAAGRRESAGRASRDPRARSTPPAGDADPYPGDHVLSSRSM